MPLEPFKSIGQLKLNVRLEQRSTSEYWVYVESQVVGTDFLVEDRRNSWNIGVFQTTNRGKTYVEWNDWPARRIRVQDSRESPKLRQYRSSIRELGLRIGRMVLPWRPQDLIEEARNISDTIIRNAIVLDVMMS